MFLDHKTSHGPTCGKLFFGSFLVRGLPGSHPLVSLVPFFRRCRCDRLITFHFLVWRQLVWPGFGVSFRVFWSTFLHTFKKS